MQFSDHLLILQELFNFALFVHKKLQLNKQKIISILIFMQYFWLIV